MQRVKVAATASAIAFTTACLVTAVAGDATAQSARGAGADQARRGVTEAKIDPGRREYESNCAVCHGSAGRGDGPVVELLRRVPPELTQLSRRNGGVFPIDSVYQTIEGGSVAAHGTREMPIWGRDYRIQGAEYYRDVPYDPEIYVRTRLLWLVEYLSRLQQR
ncbi:MAG: c-type cytochrome [Betaproteobacteria bacterium]